jgi:hypothetical protein
MSLEQKSYPSKFYVLLLFVIPLAIYFYFGLAHLTQFETADEHFWINEEVLNGNDEIVTSRIPDYWKAMRAKDWENTNINDKPGITLAMVSGLGQYIQDGWANRITNQMKFSTVYDPAKSEKMNFSFRLPILIFNGIMLVYLLLVLRRLMRDNWMSLIAASLIALCPILIGISQIINPDALLWTFTVSSLFTFMLFVLKGKWWDAVLASILLGLAFLSKYTAVILIPFFFVVMLIYLFTSFVKLEQEDRFRKKVIILTLVYPFVITGGVGVFALGLPAILVNHAVFFDGIKQIKNLDMIVKILACADLFLLMDAVIIKSWIFRNIFKYTQPFKKILPRILYLALAFVLLLTLVNWGLKNNFLNVPDIANDVRDKNLFSSLTWQMKILLEVYPFVFSLTPIVIFGMLLAWFKNIIKPREEDMYILLTLSTFFVAFYVGVIMQNLQVNIRYSVLLYAIGIVVSAIGLAIPFGAFEKFRFNNLAKMFLFLGIIAIASWNVWLIKPFYFNYMNDLLPKKYIVNGGWGYGGYEAAQYINSQASDPKTLIAWTDYEGFCPFFAGRCLKGSQLKWNKKDTVSRIDYYVTSRRGMMLSEQMWSSLADNRDEKPVWELYIDGRPDNFIRVYKNIKKENFN